MFYKRAKDADIKKPLGETVNSARSSLGSMGSKLEARRQQFKDKMKTSVSKGIDGEATESTQEKPKSENVEKMDATATPDQSVDHTVEQKTTQKEEAAKEASTEKATAEEPVAAPKVSLKERLLTRCAAYNENLSQKYPSLHKKASSTFDYCSEVWVETFPQNKKIAK